MAIGYDFNFFWQAAGAILHGQSPYTVGGFFSPYPLALLLVPFALLPFRVAYGAWTVLNVALLARSSNRWGFLRAVLFFPVAFDLLQGQVDLLVFLLSTRMDWLGAVVSAVRPQLAIWILPFVGWTWWKARKYDQFWKAALGVGVLYGVSTLLEPGWWSSWLQAVGVGWQYNGQSASLFGLASVMPFPHAVVFAVIGMCAVIALLLLRPRSWRSYWQWVALFNPFANVYSLVVLFDQADWGAIVLGVLALPLSLLLHTNAVWAIIPLYLILKDRLVSALQSRRAVQEPAQPGT